ncbi:metal ABC transporter ATP-binding protein [bacterium]|nr:metal ABC transporter ATP-binding protein [bacterium]|tara:strand:- start:677 stop:1408 length:732 start_codon:yes stop_codon:yes gene_type:complete
MLIKANNISVVRGNKKILEDINLSIDSKDFITILGPNGAGKSMLLKCLLGFFKPDEGEIIKSDNLKISYSPQDFIIDKSIPITALDFIMLNKKIEKDAIINLSKDFFIEDLLKKQLSYLSGGELQKVLITRSLIDNPDLLILDEPTQNLDVSGQLNFYKFLNKIYEERDISILMVSHDLHMVISTTKKVICLSNHICCSGEPSKITQDPEFITLFGHDFANMMSLYKHDFNHTHHTHKGDKNA